MLKKAAGSVLLGQKPGDHRSQFGIAAAPFIQKGIALLRVEGQGGLENLLYGLSLTRHSLQPIHRPIQGINLLA
jgi:hypothetical protein